MRTTQLSRTIVAAIDGSDDSLAALDWAAETAAARGLGIDLLHCTPASAACRRPDPVTEAVTRCRLTAPTVSVTATVTASAPTGSLIERSANAELLVLGATGTGTTPDGSGAGALGSPVGPSYSGSLGSVADVVTNYARCPVVVVRAEPVTPSAARPVVVGIDRGGSSTALVGFAFDEAARRGTRLVAVHGWTFAGGLGGAASARVLEGALTGWRDKHPGVEVEERLVYADAAEALAVESIGAALVAVGAHGRPSASDTLLGPVSQELLARARCPVAVVRTTSSEPPAHPWLHLVGAPGES